MLRQYVDKLFEAKEIELKLERKDLHIKTSKLIPEMNLRWVYNASQDIDPKILPEKTGPI